MTRLKERKGLIIFLAIIAIVLVCALYAYHASGPLGIEERFSQALGISTNDTNETPEKGFFGFSIEGNPVLYSGILAGLIIVCFILYKYAKK